MPAETPTNGPGDTLQVLAIAGSLRRESYNRRFLEAAGRRAPAGTSITLYEDLASVPLLDEDLDRDSDGGPEAVAELRRRVRECDGLLIATPEYNQSIPGVLKNAIDWLSLPRPDAVLAGKPVALLGATSGPWGTRFAQAALRHVLLATGSMVLAGPALYARDAGALMDEAGRLYDAATLARLDQLLAAFSRWIALTAS